MDLLLCEPSVQPDRYARGPGQPNGGRGAGTGTAQERSAAVSPELLPPARLHDLRHIHATTLLLAGVPVHVVAARLGHADPSVTLRVYAHVIRDQVAEAADVFARSIPGPGGLVLANLLARGRLRGRRGAVDLGALGGTRTPNLLIRRYLRGHPDPFRSVRDLGLVSAGCPGGSGATEGCSSVWLPAWLPGARLAGIASGFQEHLWFMGRRRCHLRRWRSALAR